MSRTLRGDGSVVARVGAVGNTSGWAKSGVMIRGDAGAGAGYAFSFFTPNTNTPGQGANFEYRNGAGSAAQSAANTGGVSAPGWVKLVRRGGAFTAYRSADGVSWLQNGPAVSIAMA